MRLEGGEVIPWRRSSPADRAVPWDTVCSQWMPAPTLALLVAARLLVPAIEGEAPPATDAGTTEGASPQAIDRSLRIRSRHVDAAAVQQGLRLRVGEGWQRWAIEVDDAAAPGQVDVRLRDRGGHIHARTLTLEGETADERSRALASSLALLVEQIDESGDRPPTPPADEEPTPVPASAPRSAPVSGFIGVGPRMAFNPGSPLHVDVGASLVGGAWLARDHVVPVGELAWARSRAGELTVDALRMGAGLMGGAAGKRGQLWGGGGALMRAQWARARASTTAAGWWASPAVMGAIQYRGRILVVGAWVGADLLLPPLRARGDAHVLRWTTIRPMATLHVGLRLPPRRR